MPEESKRTEPTQVIFSVSKDKDGDDDVFHVSWGDLSIEESTFEDALAGLGEMMRERFVALASVFQNLDSEGQEKLKRLCAVFAPEKLAEAESADPA